MTKQIIKLFILLYIFLSLSFLNSKGLNLGSNNYYYLLKVWSHSDCTGELVEFLMFSENIMYTELIDRTFYCDPNSIPIKCNHSLKYFEIDAYNGINKVITAGICNEYTTLHYIKESDFDYDESQFCVMTEYSTNNCMYKPLFHMGYLTKRKVCVFGLNLECSALEYNLQTCKTSNPEDPFNYQLIEESTEKIATYTCGKTVKNTNATSKLRGYMIHASTIDGVNDPVIDRIRNLNSSSSSLYNSPKFLIITFITIFINVYLNL